MYTLRELRCISLISRPMTDPLLLDNQGVPGHDADALDGGVHVQVDRFRWEAGQYVQSSNGHSCELGELRLQLERLILGRKAVDDFLAQFGLHPEDEARHSDPTRSGLIRRVSIANQLIRALHGIRVHLLVVVAVAAVLVVVAVVTAERSIMSTHEDTLLAR